MIRKGSSIFILGTIIVTFFSCASAEPAKTPEPEKIPDTSVFVSTGTYQYQENVINIRARNYSIPAVVTMPVDKSGKFPVVVMLHGFGSNKDEAGNGYKLLAPELAKNGIGSVRIDFMGLGDSTEDHEKFDITIGATEAVQAAGYTATLAHADPNRFGIMGWSKGGTIAMLAAGWNPLFKSVVTWAGAPKLDGVYTHEAYETAKRDGVYVATFDWREPLKLSRKAFDVVAETDVLRIFSASQAPVLAITGSEDRVVPPENARLIMETSSNSNSRYLEIPGADHTFNIFSGNKQAFYDLMTETIAWFKETL